MTKKITLSLISFVMATSIVAGDMGKNVGIPVSTVVPIVETQKDYPMYLGVGVGKTQLTDSISDEKFDSNAYMLFMGIEIHKYLSIEARYAQSFGKMAYEKGNTQNTTTDDAPIKISTYGVGVKPKYNYKDFGVYGYLGYGYSSVNAVPLGIKGRAERSEGDFQYAIGAEYGVGYSFNIFVDYFGEYSKKGIDGRANSADVDISMYSLGVSYEF